MIGKCLRLQVFNYYFFFFFANIYRYGSKLIIDGEMNGGQLLIVRSIVSLLHLLFR